MSSESEREKAIRRLLAEAVEPVEPGPGAQARLLARARAQQRRRRRPSIAHLAMPAVLASLLAVLGVLVVFAARGGGGRSASTSAGSNTAAGPAGMPSAATAQASASPIVPGPEAGSSSDAAKSPQKQSQGTTYSPSEPQAASGGVGTGS